jgi:hypothetical protein
MVKKRRNSNSKYWHYPAWPEKKLTLPSDHHVETLMGGRNSMSEFFPFNL